MRFQDGKRLAAAPALLALVVLAGCGITPKHFRKINDPAPSTRARAVGLSKGLPPGQVVPVLIKRLEDRDPVVRLAAYEELHKTTGQSFGYVYWATDEERAQAVGRWKAWWNAQQSAAPAGPVRRR